MTKEIHMKAKLKLGKTIEISNGLCYFDLKTRFIH